MSAAAPTPTLAAAAACAVSGMPPETPAHAPPRSGGGRTRSAAVRSVSVEGTLASPIRRRSPMPCGGGGGGGGGGGESPQPPSSGSDGGSRGSVQSPDAEEKIAFEIGKALLDLGNPWALEMLNQLLSVEGLCFDDQFEGLRIFKYQIHLWSGLHELRQFDLEDSEVTESIKEYALSYIRFSASTEGALITEEEMNEAQREIFSLLCKKLRILYDTNIATLEQLDEQLLSLTDKQVALFSPLRTGLHDVGEIVAEDCPEISSRLAGALVTMRLSVSPLHKSILEKKKEKLEAIEERESAISQREAAVAERERAILQHQSIRLHDAATGTSTTSKIVGGTVAIVGVSYVALVLATTCHVACAGIALAALTCCAPYILLGIAAAATAYGLYKGGQYCFRKCAERAADGVGSEALPEAA